MHGPIADRPLALVIAPRDGVLHPFLVVALGVVLMRVRTPAFLAIRRRVHGDDRLRQEILELEGLDEIAIPDHGAVADVQIADGLCDGIDLADAFLEDSRSAEDGTIVLHRTLHGEADLAGPRPAFGVADAIEPGDRRVAGTGRQRLGGRVRRYETTGAL